MREIKFRAWDKKRKEMVPDLCDWAIYESKEGFELRLGEPIKNHIGGFTEGGGILMQYTGLKDKNGKEIYEGDIVKYLPINAVVVIKFGTVSIGTDDWGVEHIMTGFYGKFQDDSTQQLGLETTPEKYKVIGNIYENPELLKEKSQKPINNT